MAKVNLAAVLVHEEQLDFAEIMREEIKSTTLEGNHLLLLTNCLELSAQMYIQRQDWWNAEFSLAVADELLVFTQSVDRPYIEKWKAVVKSLKNKEVVAELARVREFATVAQHWETIRDCDFYTARIRGDHQLL